MRVKVTPPYEGAGSFEAESSGKAALDGHYLLFTGEIIPESWCEPIPEITPEPGDIVEVNRYIGIYRHKDPTGHHIVDVYGGKLGWDNCRVLARKVKGFEEVEKEFVPIFNRCGVTYRQSYDALVALIFGGVEYGRVK